MAAGRVYALDANSYFARPGPRVVQVTVCRARVRDRVRVGVNLSLTWYPNPKPNPNSGMVQGAALLAYLLHGVASEA